jgi:uncharacterized protein (TIGR02466 family)
MNINPIFSSFLAIDQLPTIDNTCLIDYTNDLKKNSSGVIKSNVNGWQSDTLTIPNVEISKLVDIVLDRARTVSAWLNVKKDAQLFMTNLWINSNPIAGFNRPHIHPDTLIAGVYYVSYPQQSGSIIFKHPAINFQYHVGQSILEKTNEFTSANWIVNPTPGMLLLFPGWLEHYVEPNTSTEDRISIAFNLSVSVD